jgi:hypothetical protein
MYDFFKKIIKFINLCTQQTHVHMIRFEEDMMGMGSRRV